MKRNPEKLVWLLTLITLVSLISCGTPLKALVIMEPLRGDGITGGDIVEMSGYSILAPLGKNWGMETDEGKKEVTFSRQKIYSLSGQVIGYTLITVRQRNIQSQETMGMSEEEVAEHFLDKEEKPMFEAVKDVKNIKKESITIDGKKVYTISGSATVEVPGIDMISERAIFLYFPPEFSDNHNFYLFAIEDAYQKYSWAAFADISQIFPIIKSLTIAKQSVSY